METDDMLKNYIEKRKQCENKIQEDLLKIEESVIDIPEVGDYFSIKNEDSLITIKAILINDEKHIAIYTEDNEKEIPFYELNLIEHPDLILWIIQNDSLIKEGFEQVLINAVRNGEHIINTLKALKVNYK